MNPTATSTSATLFSLCAWAKFHCEHARAHLNLQCKRTRRFKRSSTLAVNICCRSVALSTLAVKFCCRSVALSMLAVKLCCRSVALSPLVVKLYCLCCRSIASSIHAKFMQILCGWEISLTCTLTLPMQVPMRVSKSLETDCEGATHINNNTTTG